jgi:hypothetical protein
VAAGRNSVGSGDGTFEGSSVGICVLDAAHGTPVPKPHTVEATDGMEDGGIVGARLG